jgi:hypothetical protein
MRFMKDPRPLSAHEATIPVPPEKVTGIKKKIAYRLKTDLAKTDLVYRGALGSKVNNPMLGDVANLLGNASVLSRIMAHTKINIDEFDVGFGAAENLAKELQFMALPEVSVCDHCHQFPISEVGGQIILVLEGECPMCQEGLITPMEQAKPYYRWTDHEKVSPISEWDDDYNPGQPVPTTDRAILEGAQKPDVWYAINPRVLAMLKEYDVTIVHFCDWLTHGPKAGLFNRQYEQVLMSLDNPSRFGACTENALRYMVRDQAKGWKPTTTKFVVTSTKEEIVKSPDPRGSRPSVFVLFSSENERQFASLKKHLAPVCEVLSHEDIKAGELRSEAIPKLVGQSKMVILLGSADAFSEGLDAKALRLIGDSGKPCVPIIVEACLYEYTKVAHLHPLGRDKPSKKDGDWSEVAAAIRGLLFSR